MIVHGCIEIHPKECERWIIVMGFGVLKLFVHAGGVKIKVSRFRCCNDVSSLQKKVNGGIPVLVCTLSTICSSQDHGRKMVGSISSASNVHEVVNDNNNPYRTIVMDAMRMNQGHTDQFPIIDKEPNANATKFFIF